jgi:hypothetical protein
MSPRTLLANTCQRIAATIITISHMYLSRRFVGTNRNGSPLDPDVGLALELTILLGRALNMAMWVDYIIAKIIITAYALVLGITVCSVVDAILVLRRRRALREAGTDEEGERDDRGVGCACGGDGSTIDDDGWWEEWEEVDDALDKDGVVERLYVRR